MLVKPHLAAGSRGTAMPMLGRRTFIWRDKSSLHGAGLFSVCSDCFLNRCFRLLGSSITQGACRAFSLTYSLHEAEFACDIFPLNS